MSNLPAPPSVPWAFYNQTCHFLRFIFLRQLFARISKAARGSREVLTDVPNLNDGIFTCPSKSALNYGFTSCFPIVLQKTYFEWISPLEVSSAPSQREHNCDQVFSSSPPVPLNGIHGVFQFIPNIWTVVRHMLWWGDISCHSRWCSMCA